MSEQGRVVEVSALPLGAPLAADAVTGATTLTVVDLADFNEDGGSVQLVNASTGATEILNYSKGDDTTGILTLVSPVVGGTYVTDTFVQVYPEADEKIAQVVLDGEDDALTAVIPHSLYDRLDEGIREIYDQESVTVELDDGGEWVIVDVLGKQPVINPAFFNPGLPLPDYIPITAPVVSPTIQVFGMPNSFVISADQSVIAAGTQLEYHISKTSGVPTAGDPATLSLTSKANPYVAVSLPDGTPFVMDTPYYFHTIAVNAAGTAAASAEVIGYLDLDAVQDAAYARVIAGFALFGTVQVGGITIDSVTGITIPQTGYTPTNFPVDGSPAQISGIVTAQIMTILGKLTLRGTDNQIAPGASLTISQGVTAPTSKPGVEEAYSSIATTIGFPTAQHGLVEKIGDATKWVSAVALFGGGLTEIVKTTGVASAVTAAGWMTNFNITGGITKVGSFYYVLGFDGARSNAFYVYKLDSTYAKTAEFLFGTNVPHQPAIGSDGTDLFICWATTTALRVRKYTIGGSLTSETVLLSGVTNDLGGVYVGSADFGAGRIVVGAVNGTVWVFNSSTFAEVTSQEWTGANAKAIIGLVWDGTNFRTLDKGGNIWLYSTIVTSTARSIDYSWYDSDATGGTHETNRGPARAYTQKPRTWFLVTTDSPYDTGGTDDPDSVRIWVGGQRQPDLGAGVTTATYGAPATGTTTKATDFASAGTSIAAIQSAAVDGGSVPLTYTRGDGTGRRMLETQSGQVGTGTMVANTDKTVSVAFAVPFLTAALAIQVTAKNTVNPELFSVVTANVTTTGFDIIAKRTTGTGGFNCDWTASVRTQ